MKKELWKNWIILLPLTLTSLLFISSPASCMLPCNHLHRPLQKQKLILMNLADFSSFASQGKTPLANHPASGAVVYTRVSSKEQADKNLSLETQRKAIAQYAERNNIEILGFFGGTYESAKTDGRKEFQRMLRFIGEQEGRIGQILVYTLDRFSRTGGAAIKLASDLREQHGISVFAVMQPTDTRNPSGILHQNIQLLFSEYDNQLRKQKAVAGLQEKFARGIWATRPPQGYDIVKTNGERKLVINEEGKLIRQAFLWKYEGLKNETIIERLNALGLPMYKQQLCKIFKKPFYCGVISHGLLNGQVVEGTHERMIDPEVFLKINHKKASAVHGVPARKENEALPLKVFVRCSHCNAPLTGYEVKARGLYYYKCRTNGCHCNLNAVKLHQDFEAYLQRFSLDEAHHVAMREQLAVVFASKQFEYGGLETQLKSKLTETDKKIDALEEKFYVQAEVTKDIFEKFHARYKQEQAGIQKQLSDVSHLASDLQQQIEEGFLRAASPFLLWQRAAIRQKEKLGHLLFPAGLLFDHHTRQFSCAEINPAFRIAPTT